jgi:hypothetical protein
MTNSQREFYLKVGAAAVVGLLLLDHFVLSPATEHWKEQSTRIADLREKVQRGQQLLGRKEQIQARWAEMLRTNLPADNSSAEFAAEEAVGRWENDSRITLASLTNQWQNRDEGFETFECRVAADGDQASLGRFIYELESDPLPVHLEECELSTRDARGSQLTLTARFTFLRLATQTGNTAK